MAAPFDIREVILQYLENRTSPSVALEFGLSVSVVDAIRAGTRKPPYDLVQAAWGEYQPQGAPPPTLLEPTANWEGKKVALLFPWYKTVNPVTCMGLMAMLDRSRMGIIMSHGDAYIAHSRDSLAQRFLRTQCEWAFMVDDDMMIPFGNPAAFRAFTGFDIPDQYAGLHTLNQLISRQKTLIGGLYFGRQPTGRPMYAEGVAYKDEADAARRGAPADLVKPTRWVATGCMLIHRSVFEDIDKKFPEIEQKFFSPGEHDVVTAAREAVALLEQSDAAQALAVLQRGLQLAKANSPSGVGEDVTFCVRAAAAGHQPFVDWTVVCGHVGTAVYGPKNTRNA